MKQKPILLVSWAGKAWLLLVVLLFAALSTARAQETYGLSIAGVTVTSDNCADLSVIDGVSGTVTYDAATKTLTLADAVITATGNTSAILNETVKGLKISLSGNSYVTADYPAIASFKSLTLQGDGTITAVSSEKAGITVEAGTLTIDNCTVVAKGSYGVRGSTGDETLVVKNDAVIKAEGNNGSLVFFSSLQLDGSGKVVHPLGAVYDQSLKGITLNGEVVGTQVVIDKSMVYGLKVAGIEVTNRNCLNLTALAGVSGTVVYDPNTNILTLDNARIALLGNTEAITNYADSGLVINVTGENNITSNLAALSVAQPTTLQGGGTLNATSVSGAGLAIDGTTLTVTPCTVNAKGANGISGSGDGATLAVKIGSTVTAEGTDGSVVGMDSLDLESNINLDAVVDVDVADGIAIISPSRAALDKSLKAVAVNGDVTTQKVTIGKLKVYAFFINGEYVTNANCNDLSVIEGVSGAMIFDPETFTLTLKNAVINTEYEGFAIRYDRLSPNVTIKLLGENHIVTYGSPLGITAAPATITGGGSLDILSADAMCADSLTFDDCTIKIKTYDAQALRGTDVYYHEYSTYTVRNADITAESHNDVWNTGVISTMRSFVLDGSEIVQPVGAAFDDSLCAVALNGVPVYDKIVIRRTGEKYGFKVAGVDVTSNNCNDLSIIPNVSGNVKYDPETKTLFLENATIEAYGDDKGIDNDTIDRLNINVTGENTIRASHSAIMANATPTVIKGYGTLNALANRGAGIYFRNALEIDNCTANLKGNWALMGYDGTSEKLTINNAAVTMTGAESPLEDVRSLALVNCVVTAPEGAVFSSEKHAFTLYGSVVTDSIAIMPDTATRYDVVLEECPDNEEEIVALVQQITGLSEAESVALVESAPCVVLSDVSPAVARQICHAFAKLSCPANNYLHDTWDPTGIKGIATSYVAPRQQGIYSINGVYLGRDFDKLPKGVYIKDGKKVLK